MAENKIQQGLHISLENEMQFLPKIVQADLL